MRFRLSISKAWYIHISAIQQICDFCHRPCAFFSAYQTKHADMILCAECFIREAREDHHEERRHKASRQKASHNG